MGLIDITRQIRITAVCPSEDTTYLDGGFFRYIDNGAASDTLLEAATIGCTYLPAYKIDDRRGGDTIGIGLGNSWIMGGNNLYGSFARYSGCGFLIAHTHTTVVACTEDLHRGKV